MKHHPLLLSTVGLLVSGVLLARVGGSPPLADINRARQEWVQSCLEDFRKVKVGMTRKQVESNFPKDGGLQSLTTPIRYAHPACPYFMIDVEFDSPRTLANSATKGASKDDKVSRVSKPYIEYPSQD